MQRPKILIVDDEPSHRFLLERILNQHGQDPAYEIMTAEDGQRALQLVEEFEPDLMILDIRMPGMDGIEVLKKVRSLNPSLLVIMNTAFDTRELSLEAIRSGAYDYFTKPVQPDELRIVVRRSLDALNLRRQVSNLQNQLGLKFHFDRLVAQSEPMKRVFSLLERIAPNDVTVLVTGPSGTGKELVARAIHNNSPRRNKPYISVNCAAIPDNLLESELFGHERGAFTGAIATKPGKFELAEGGTIFLDEIGEMPYNVQSKLLRVLQEREITRVGGTKASKINVRVLAATNRNLAEEVAQQRFREDLYFRLNVFPVQIPALCERREDIPLLARHFVEFYNGPIGRNVHSIEPNALAALSRYNWPGNVRELENAIQRALVMANDSEIGLYDLPREISDFAESEGIVPSSAATKTPPANILAKFADAPLVQFWDSEFLSDMTIPLQTKVETVTDQLEREVILRALEQCQQHRQATADLLGISRKSLHNKMTKLGLFSERPDSTESDPGL